MANRCCCRRARAEGAGTRLPAAAPERAVGRTGDVTTSPRRPIAASVRRSAAGSVMVARLARASRAATKRSSTTEVMGTSSRTSTVPAPSAWSSAMARGRRGPQAGPRHRGGLRRIHGRAPAAASRDPPPARSSEASTGGATAAICSSSSVRAAARGSPASRPPARSTAARPPGPRRTGRERQPLPRRWRWSASAPAARAAAARVASPARRRWCGRRRTDRRAREPPRPRIRPPRLGTAPRAGRYGRARTATVRRWPPPGAPRLRAS